MFLKLSEKSFIKQKPDVWIYSSFKDNTRQVLSVNKSAFDILSLCDGTNSVTDISNELKVKYNSESDAFKEFVEIFINPLIKEGLVETSENKEVSTIQRGDANIHYPDIMIFEITYNCPLDCKHCYLRSKDNKFSSKEDMDKMLELVDKTGIYKVQITGGEALTHPLFDYLVYELIKRGLIVTIASSGFVLNEKILNALKVLNQVKGSYISISLDGDKKSHNNIRNNELSYDKTIKFLETMAENEIPFRIGTTIIDQSQQELEEMVAKIKEIGASSISMGTVFSLGNAIKNELSPSFEGEKYNQFLKNLSDKYNDEKFIVESADNFGCIERESCSLGHKMIRVRPNLDITPCNLMEAKLGNLKEQSIEEIMSQYGKMLHDLIVPCRRLCGDCEKINVCKNCPAQGLASKDKVKNCKWFENQKDVLNLLLKTQ